MPLYKDGATEYEIEMPCCSKDGLGRESRWTPVLVPQEELDAELRDTPGWAEELQTAINEGAFPPSYDDHPVVVASTRPVVPIALFVDGVPYSHVDSIIGFWIINMLTGRRHLVAAVRKAILSCCGCSSW